MREWIWLTLGLSVVALAAAACTGGAGDSPAGAASTGLARHDDGEGGVRVQMTWLTAAEIASDGDLVEAATPYDVQSYLLLHVRMDTHSGNLNRYDLAAGSEMVVDGGPPQAPVAWQPLGGSSHHRQALLVFERPRGAASVEVALKELAGVPRRVFRWAPPAAP